MTVNQWYMYMYLQGSWAQGGRLWWLLCWTWLQWQMLPWQRLAGQWLDEVMILTLTTGSLASQSLRPDSGCKGNTSPCIYVCLASSLGSPTFSMLHEKIKEGETGKTYHVRDVWWNQLPSMAQQRVCRLETQISYRYFKFLIWSYEWL